MTLVDTIRRKAEMNLFLSFHSVWIILLIACIAGTWRLLNGAMPAGRSQRAMVVGAASATAASFALNDAGVVAGALSALYLWTAAAYVSAPPAGHQPGVDSIPTAAGG
jgi:hypothetical protein